MDQSKAIKYLIYAIVAIVVVLVLIYTTKWIRKFFGFSKEAPSVILPPTPYQDGGGNVGISFPVESYVAELWGVLDAWLLDASPRCEAYERLMSVSDNEFIAILNSFYDTYGVTLRSKINATWQSGCSVFAKQWDDRVLERMNRLNVSR